MAWPIAGGGAAAGATGASAAGGQGMVAAVGDSITANGWSVGTAVLSYRAVGFLTWAMAMSRGALWCPLVCTGGQTTPLVNYNRAVTGKTAAQVLSEQIPEVLALNPRPAFCSVLCGTNNLTVNTSQTAAEIAAEIIAIADALLAARITPVVCAILPRGNGTAAGWGSLSAGQIATARGRLLEVNRLLRAWSASEPSAIFVDWYHTTLNYASATSDPQVGYLADYLHPNAPGAILLGQKWWDTVSARVPAVINHNEGTGDAWSSTDNPYGSMLDSSWSAGGGTAGTGTSGTVPSGWTANRLSGATSTAAIARQARADGVNGNEVTITMTGSDTATFRLYQGASTISDSNFTAGDGVFVECDVVFSGAGANQSLNPDIEFRMSNPASFRLWSAYNQSEGAIQGSFNMRLRSPIVVLPAGGGWSVQGWTVDGIANGGSNVTTRRNYVVRKYNKAAVGAVTW